MRFSDDTWKIAKIGDVLTIERGGSPRPIQNFVTRRLDGINWIKIGDTSDDGYIYSAKEKIIPEGVKHSRKVKVGDLLLSNSMSFGKPYILKINGCIHDGWLVIRDMDNKFSKEFLRNYLGSSFCISQYKKLAAGGVVTNLNKDLVCSAIIKYPPMTSQEKIASFLCALDERIRTQNKIIEDLKTLRKGIIDSLFASSEYEERLATFLQERKTYSEKGEGFEHVTLSKEGICAKTERYDRDFLVTTEDKNYKITKQNDICYNPANLKFGVICLNTYGDAIFSPIYVTFEVKNIDPYYLSLFLTSNRFIKKALRYQQGTVYERMAVNPEDFCKCKIPLNDNKTIQQTTKLVSLIDLKIKTEESIIQKYKTQKDYLLANLFI